MDLQTDKYCTLKKIIDNDTINNIMFGEIKWSQKVSSTRTINKIYKGCVNMTDLDLKYLNHVVLPDGRIDVNLPEELYNKLISKKTMDKILSNFDKTFKIVHVNLLINPYNENVQMWHQDNSSIDPNEYYTLLMPLVDEPMMGKTEIIVPYTYNFSKKHNIITPNVTIGDGLCFSGCLWHRGTANLSKKTRYCIYMIISSHNKNELFENWK